MIDPSGNIINPETKEVIKLNVPDYVPTKEEIEKQINAIAPVPEKSSLATGIESAIQQKVNEAVVNAIGKIDIGKMVEKAVNAAFGGSK